jgi:cytochrome c5
MIFVFLLSMGVACSSDNEEDVAPQPQPQPCDTENVTFAETVTPILSANCYSCHSTSVATAGIVLDTHAGVKKQADNGSLIGTITHAAGFTPMPQGGAKLSDCNIEKIKKWVEDGAEDN